MQPLSLPDISILHKYDSIREGVLSESGVFISILHKYDSIVIAWIMYDCLVDFNST